MTNNTVEKIEVPAWDIALEALVREEQQHCQRPLTVADFRRLATAHAIRFDDIMATMFELVLQGIWHYQPSAAGESIDRPTIDGLYINRRLKDADVMAFAGDWSMADQDGQ